ncbi:F0F1 ATP synthase subunit delta [Streptococcus uberis]|uniref:F0F1 ATP synthase subunit delta n=1 Tax=Streptococcus uberis TaxID=1349 RepID=UPI0012B5E27D|nr:F0F1 ATP synthase subunit delta [Streptococcus uberis]MTB62248.1 F0F1 ATP synthase subunit delta [Streptococcus uberis]MTB93121.1 F0F1 ATP synthase subunit delta [Streptococcus uberis]MTC88695.1 F0F1 ATP synthase subunit delta [Streptococcus uberis]
MTKKELALIEQYAKSLVEVAIEKDFLNGLKEDVYAILETMQISNLDNILSSLAFSQDDKANLVRLLKDSSSVYVNNFLDVVLQNQREYLLFDMLKTVLKEIAQETNTYDVTVTSAIPLTEEQKNRVISVVMSKFGIQTGRLIETNDASIIGGFIISVNNQVIDTSIKRQLHDFKMKLI